MNAMVVVAVEVMHLAVRHTLQWGGGLGSGVGHLCLICDSRGYSEGVGYCAGCRLGNLHHFPQ